MAIQFDDLKSLFIQEGLQFYLHPNSPIIMSAATGLVGQHQFLVSLYDDGAFLQFRAIHYGQCMENHAHFQALLRLLSRLNLDFRLTRFFWDERDGEIVVTADHWIVDGTLTQRQFRRLLSNFLSAIDVGRFRIRNVLETGVDSGEESPQAVAVSLLAGKASLPRGVRELVESLASQQPPSDKPPEEPSNPPKDIETL